MLAILEKMLSVYGANQVLRKNKNLSFTSDEAGISLVLFFAFLIMGIDYTFYQYFNQIKSDGLQLLSVLGLLIVNVILLVLLIGVLIHIKEIFAAISKVYFKIFSVNIAKFRVKQYEKNKSKLNDKVKVSYQHLYEMFKKRGRLDVLELLIDGMDSRNRFSPGNFFVYSVSEIYKILDELDVNVLEEDLSFKSMEKQLVDNANKDSGESNENILFFSKKS